MKALPAYLRIASHFAQEIEAGRLSQGEKIGPERALARKYGVNRGTVRAALHQLRQRRLVVTDARGTSVTAREQRRPVTGGEPVEPESVAAAFPGVEGARGLLHFVPIPQSVAPVLGLEPRSPVLVYQSQSASDCGDRGWDTTTYFTPATVAKVPQLDRYVSRTPVANPDLRLLRHWMEEAGLSAAVDESITFTRPEPHEPGHHTLTVAIRRRLSDQNKRVIALTDIEFPQEWRRISLHHASATLPHVEM
ncbi:GntR family transcriptional regulator [Streptomyces sp. NPDC091267]|uniref:GntR family transcriptional regulator n=1 Tax=unclassified Streptomyces TaxID=2593676 RepID=UPI0034289CA6